jgi:streptogramin lyase
VPRSQAESLTYGTARTQPRHTGIGSQFSPKNGAGWGITAGPDGNVWLTQTHYIGKINPTTHATTSFQLPGSGRNSFNSAVGITAGPDGNLWFTDQSSSGAGYIGMIDPTTGSITEFAVPYANSRTGWITVGSDGNLWFTDSGTNAIGIINPTTHAITEFLVGGTFPDGIITAGPDGNLWFPLTNGIGEFNPTTHAIAVLPIPAAVINSSFITAGPDGNVWFTDAVPGAGRIGRVNLTTDAITEYPIPYTNTFPQGITAGPDGNLWFADHGTHAIGVATLASTELVVTSPPPSSVTAGSPFGLTVQAEDSSGNLVSSFNGTVTVALASNPGGSTLGGTLSVQAPGGIAIFTGLTLNNTGSGYELYVSGGGLGPRIQ